MQIVGGVPEAVVTHASVAADYQIPLGRSLNNASPQSSSATNSASTDDGEWPANNRIYTFGGLSGRVRGDVIRIDLPSDLCSLWNDSPHFCRITPGCGYCKVYDDEPEKGSGGGTYDPDRGKTYCVSNSAPSPNV